MKQKTVPNDILERRRKELSVLEDKRSSNQENINYRIKNFNSEIYPKLVTLGLSIQTFDETTFSKVLTILSSILTYEELRYILINLKEMFIHRTKERQIRNGKLDEAYRILNSIENSCNETIEEIRHK